MGVCIYVCIFCPPKTFGMEDGYDIIGYVLSVTPCDLSCVSSRSPRDPISGVIRYLSEMLEPVQWG